MRTFITRIIASMRVCSAEKELFLVHLPLFNFTAKFFEPVTFNIKLAEARSVFRNTLFGFQCFQYVLGSLDFRKKPKINQVNHFELWTDSDWWFLEVPCWFADARVIFKQNSWLVVCLGGKHNNLVLFWKIFSSYINVSVDYDTINNSGKYFTCRVCNLENIVRKL